MATFWQQDAGQRSSWEAVRVTHPVLNRSGRPGNQLYASLEYAGHDPGHPRLQVVVPDDPWLTRLPTGRQRGIHATGNEALQSRDWVFGLPEPNMARSIPVEQTKIPSTERGQQTWLDQQQSWLNWAEVSFPQEGQSLSDQPTGEFDLDMVLSSADPAITDLDSTTYADHQEQARWGSDPAFTANVFLPPSHQLSEKEVTSIWEDYVVASLKPVVNILGTNVPTKQLLIVGNNSHGSEIDDVEPNDSRAAQAVNSSFSDPKRLKQIDGRPTPPPAIDQRGPLRPFRAGRKRPMPPRAERRYGEVSNV